MPTTLILGGSGKVARHLTRQLVAQSYTVHSVIRNSAHSSDLQSLGAKPIVQSIEESSVSDLASTIKSCGPDVVVWSAGAGGGNPERTKTVDQEGAIKSFDACKEAGVSRYIIVSAVDVRDRSKNKYPEWYDDESKTRSDKVWGAIGAYMEAKLQADKNLRTQNDRRGLDYTIVRPGGLSTDSGVGKVSAGKVSLEKTISREDVASVIIECIKNKGTVGMAFDVVGGNTPIQQAVQDVVDAKVDTFEGQY
jgi:nucleoside-diphosphate-sugar epimerase